MWAEYGPLAAALAAALAAVLAYLTSRSKQPVDEATARKIKTEIEKGQRDNELAKARGDARRDRHIIRLDKWGFEKVMPWSRRATTIVTEQNELLVELAARANIPYEPKSLEPLPAMPQIDDDEDE
jgi:hypothetical protein